MVTSYTEDPDPHLLQKAKAAGLKIGLCAGAYQGECAADPQSLLQLKEKVTHLVSLSPDEIWIDHLRFHGRWETEVKQLVDSHLPCQFCENIDRKKIVASYFTEVKKLVPDTIKLGFFAAPFTTQEFPDYPQILGLDYQKIKDSVDMISPMLYHRAINKPPIYISAYVQYLHDLGYQHIVPIIQVKDMPDNLPDEYSVEELEQAYQEAIKPPSAGVAIFTWDHALEKGKTETVVELLSE